MELTLIFLKLNYNYYQIPCILSVVSFQSFRIQEGNEFGSMRIRIHKVALNRA